MKYILIALLFTLLFNGCSHQNAFSRFKMQKQEEKGISNSQSGKIMLDKEIYGVFSAIYLDDIDLPANEERFYAYFYFKDIDEKDIVNYIKQSLTLNAKPIQKIEELQNKNRFSYLSSTNNEWNKYYLITFKKEIEEGELKLMFKTQKESSIPLIYHKETE